MKIFSGVYRECAEMQEVLEKINYSDAHLSEGGCRAMLNHALEAPIGIRADETLAALATQVMSMSNIDVQELNRLMLHRLLEKAKQYGDSMQYPIRAFTEASVFEHINLKIDDKLCIVYNSVSEVSESVYIDAMCYLILRKTFLRMNDEAVFRKHKIQDTIGKGAVVLAILMFLAGLLSMAFCFLK